MLETGLIEECEGPDDDIDEDARRRYYRITGVGRETLAAELAQAVRSVAVGREKRVVLPRAGKAER